MKQLIVVLACLSLIACGKSCEERGGKNKFTGNSLIYSGKTMVMVPQYSCFGARPEEPGKEYENIKGNRWWEDKENAK